MAGTVGNADRRLTFLGELERQPWAFDFYQTLRRIEGLYPALPRLGDARRPADEPVRLGQKPEMDFAASAVDGFSYSARGIPKITVRFLGLFGPMGPLPTHLTEFARERERNHGDSTWTHFADLFHHRLLLLFYRAWRQAQPTASRDRPDQDRFRAYVGSTIGLGSPAWYGRDSVSDDAKRFFAGTLARAARNADGLADILSVYLGQPVTVTSFKPQWMRLPIEQRSRLGSSDDSITLGSGAVLGARVLDAQHHFEIRIGPCPLSAYESLLPGGEWNRRVRDWLRFYVSDEFGVRLVVELQGAQVPEPRLGVGPRLGWTSWLRSRTNSRPTADLAIAISAGTDPVAVL
jgi:type VI secretion system protein ImpH